MRLSTVMGECVGQDVTDWSSVGGRGNRAWENVEEAGTFEERKEASASQEHSTELRAQISSNATGTFRDHPLPESSLQL